MDIFQILMRTLLLSASCGGATTGNKDGRSLAK